MTVTSQTLRNKRAAKSARKRLAASTTTATDAAASQNTPSDHPPVKHSSGRPRKKQADGSYRRRWKGLLSDETTSVGRGFVGNAARQQCCGRIM
eukprot:scaffold81254_cov60-Cyclotella_meneghiniana.AAC.2